MNPRIPRIIRQVFGPSNLEMFDDLEPEAKAARKQISARYSELKATHSFTEASFKAQEEWLTQYLNEFL